MDKLSAANNVSPPSESPPKMAHTDTTSSSSSETTTSTTVESATTTLISTLSTIPTSLSILTSTTTNQKPRIVKLSEYKSAALCLAEAFRHDEVAQYFTHTPDRTSRSPASHWNLHLKILEHLVYAHILKGVVLTIGDFDCVALWLPPNTNIDSFSTLVQSGLWKLRYQLSAAGRKRFFTSFMPLLHDTKAEVLGKADADSWYLVYLGTRERARGRGLGRKCVEWGTARADRGMAGAGHGKGAGKICYLESSNAVNVRIYERMGFTVVKQIVLGGEGREGGKEGSVWLDIMVREPVVPSGGAEE